MCNTALTQRKMFSSAFELLLTGKKKKVGTETTCSRFGSGLPSETLLWGAQSVFPLELRRDVLWLVQ